MILHHYEMSPFSEKVRLMLGYAGLSWQSAISPAVPPRPNIDPLTGGYRRIPVAQLGADLFCDTQIIGNEIAALANMPNLSFDQSCSEIRTYVEHLDSDVFMAVANSTSPLKVLALVFKTFSPMQGVKFIQDRGRVAKSMSRQRISSGYATQLLEEQITDLEFRLQQSKFLFGETPTIADFSAYHVLWFRKKMQGESLLDKHPMLALWLDRMSAFGHGKRTDVLQAEAFAQASQNEPRKVSEGIKKHALVGVQVQIRPDDYAQDPVVGILVGANDSRMVLARETQSFGKVHVHFPKLGYELIKVS